MLFAKGLLANNRGLLIRRWFGFERARECRE